MTKQTEPYCCTSSLCNNLGCDYCKKCSHAIWRGQGRVKGKLYKWEFEPSMGGGVEFWNYATKKYDGFPGERDPAWTAFKKWHKFNFGDN